MRTERVEKLIGAITIESGHESRVRITRGPRASPRARFGVGADQITAAGFTAYTLTLAA